MKIPDLKKRLSENDQIVSGTKAELIKVLCTATTKSLISFFFLQRIRDCILVRLAARSLDFI